MIRRSGQVMSFTLQQRLGDNAEEGMIDMAQLHGALAPPRPTAQLPRPD